MMTRMGRFLLVVALLLMTASLLAPLWVGSSRHSPAVFKASRVAGRLTGDFAEPPWIGNAISFGNELALLRADGAFSFSKFPGTYALSVCCSVRFQRVYREITVDGHDQYIEIPVEPLLTISGQVVSPRGFKQTVKISAWMIGTNTVDRTMIASDGTFAFHVMQGDWRVDFENLPPEYKLRSMTLDGKELRERTFTIARVTGPSLPLRITLQ
jgi:hypothetical protein